MLSVRMRLALLMIFMCTAEIRAASIKKSIGDSTHKPEETKKPSIKSKGITSFKSPIPAIVAIEIIDAPENSTSPSKNTSKRTIESSLGYGYQSPLGPEPPKKFVYYKYSQQDIPPYAYTGNQVGYGGVQPNIQKGVGYHVGSTTTHIDHQPSVEIQPSKQVYQTSIQQPSTNQYDHPGTTLYTTLTHQGQIGSLSNDVPYQNTDHGNGMVPVIILRIYSNQLSSPDTALHTNLPQSHPYSTLNNINLQSLLQNYVQQYLQSQQVQQIQQVQHYQMPDYQQQLYQGHGQIYQQAYQQVPEDYHTNLPTSENYPSKLHTRVIFHSNNNGHIPESTIPRAMYKTPGLSTYKTIASYKTPQATMYSEPDYSYSAGVQNLEQNYMYYYPNQDVEYQQQEENYQNEKSEETEEPEPVNPPFNYHAHPAGPSRKQRSKKSSSIEISSTLPPKRREPRT